MDRPSASPSRIRQTSTPPVSHLHDGTSSPDHRANRRVCDNCIRQKVKCDLGQPVCSRCFERGKTCTYSAIRRRPGPAPGYGRGSRGGRDPHSRRRDPTGHQSISRGSLNLEDNTAALSNASTTLEIPVQSSDTSGSPLSSHLPASVDTRQSIPADILPEEEKYLLNEYFQTIHDAIPLFSEGIMPLDSRIVSNCSHDLIEAMLLITAKLLGFKFVSDRFDLESRIDQVMSATSLQEDIVGDFPILDQFRKFCLLAFYEFHQFPGQQAWMRVGKLVRMAYWMGLDRLDMIHSVSPEWNRVSTDELEGWRLVWWCVYRLDSYANLSAGTPYQVDERLVNTSLLRDQGTGMPSRSQLQSHRLPSRPSGLQKLLLDVKNDSGHALLFNLHIITTAALRYFGRALKMHSLVPDDETAKAVLDAERNLSVLRLALPRNYLNPGRNAFANESCSDHHVRLVTVLHLLMAQLLAALASCRELPDGDDWLLGWQQVLEICQNTAAIAEKWDSSFILTVDPAVSLISFTALVFLDIHKKFAEATNPHLQSEIENCETLLLLQLEQFAGYWTLPGLLIRE